MGLFLMVKNQSHFVETTSVSWWLPPISHRSLPIMRCYSIGESRRTAALISQNRRSCLWHEYIHLLHDGFFLLPSCGRLMCWKTNYLGERLSASFFFDLMSKCKASFGQAWAQSPQRIHSQLLGVFTGSTPILQTFAQAPQLIHLS